jgi:hypothetical protein
VNPQAGKPALHSGSWKVSTLARLVLHSGNEWLIYSSTSIGQNRRRPCESLVLVVVLVLVIGNGAIEDEDEKEDEDDLVAAAPRCGVSGGEFHVVLGAQGQAGEIIGQNHQFLGVYNAIASMLAIRGRTAGLRPAAASQARHALDNPESTNEPDLLRLTEPRSVGVCSRLATRIGLSL